ncbi:MAG: hypothetical protein AAGJ18_03455 [Bacteroidota bacterium]
MIRKTRIAVLMLIAQLLTIGLTAQQNSSFYRQQGDYIFGINGGAAYQQSDVMTDWRGHGFGLTYGKNLIYAPHSPFSIDVRGRLQYNRTFGTDIRPSLGIANNEALNGSRTLDYTDEMGNSVYANHRTTQAEAGLEGVLTLNGLREATGLGLSFTGGVGLSWYKAKIDQRDSEGLYDLAYSRVDAGGAKPFNLSQLKSFRDGKYETLADDFGRIGKFGIMPALGVEVDYDLTNNIAIGLGHRVTFSGTDLLDGQQWTNANTLTGNNDLLHYTSLGLKYTFNNQKTRFKNQQQPTIELIEPYGNGLTTRKSIVPIKANISRVSNPFDVYLTVNGREQKFNFSNGTLAGQIRLKKGENKIVITANNTEGTAKKSFFLTYEIDQPTNSAAIDFGRPEINFLSPMDKATFEQNQVKIRAKVRLFDSEQNIELRINGHKKRFDFDRGINTLDALVDLRTGENTVEIRAKNRNGEERITQTLIRTAPVPFPTVRFTSPAYDNATVDNSFATVKIMLEHIEQSTDIRLLVNGQNELNFFFDYQTGQLKADVPLREGRNEVEIIAVNKRGEARDKRTIVYKRPYVPTVRRPSVTINAPQYSQSTTNEEMVVIHATVANIINKSDIRLTNNGLAIYNFDFNPNNGVLRHILYLRAGINQVVIEAQNEAGRNGASATINFEVPVVLPPPPPPVIIVAPSVDIFSPRRNDVFETDEITVKADLRGVQSQQNIEFRVNRDNCPDFRFNPSTGRFRAKVRLREGENVIALRVANQGGADRQKVIVFRENRNVPVIDVQNPISTTEKRRIKIKATIDYVENERDVELLLNNRSIRDFRFNNQRLSAEVTLREGRNDLEIVARNKYGNDSQKWTIDYDRPQPPSLRLANLEDNQTLRDRQYKIEGTAKHVGARELKLFVNGVLSKSLELDDEQFSAHILLREGRNSVVLKANTAHGEEELKLRVNYLKPRTQTVEVAPEVISQPTIRFASYDKSRRQTQQMSFDLRATLEHIGSKKDILLELNGKAFNKFEFDAKSGTLTSVIPLKMGLNRIKVIAKNAGGTVERETTMTRRSGRAVTSKSGKAKVIRTRTKSRF